MDIYLLILFACCFCLALFFLFKIKTIEKANVSDLIKEKDILSKEIESKKLERKTIEEQIFSKQKDLFDCQSQIQVYKEKINSLKDNYSLEEKTLKQGYLIKEKELKDQWEQQSNIFNDFLIKKKNEQNFLEEELKSLKATRDAAIEAARKELEIKKEAEKYMLQLEKDEIDDIEYINSIRQKLNHPEILGKLIWQVFIQKKYKTLVANIVGTETVSGIYKITCRITQESYIGRSVDIGKRWGEHIKAGCGAVQTNNTNKLYSSMKKHGVQNFTFEILEKCPVEELSKKESFYINLYSSDVYGLNSQKGDN